MRKKLKLVEQMVDVFRDTDTELLERDVVDTSVVHQRARVGVTDIRPFSERPTLSAIRAFPEVAGTFGHLKKLTRPSHLFEDKADR